MSSYNILFINIILCISLISISCQDFFDESSLLDEILKEVDNEVSCVCVDRNDCASTKEPVDINIDPDTTADGGQDFFDKIRPRTSCGSPSEICCDPGQILSIPVLPEEPSPSEIKCGFAHLLENTNVRTFQGKKANEGELPFFVAVLKDGSYQGAGSLIHPQVVLTAAHRIDKFQASELSVRLGDADLSLSPPLEERRVTSILKHPQYNPRRLINDTALLILDSEIAPGLGISTICLPVRTTNFLKDSCISGGWGDEPGQVSEKGSEILKKVTPLPFWESHSECEKVLQETEGENGKLGSRFILDESFVCAGGGLVDTCTGDGGAPLVCQIDGHPNHYVQVGVTAWGLGCGLRGVPGVYASVLHNIDWITEEVVNRFGHDGTQYFLA